MSNLTFGDVIEREIQKFLAKQSMPDTAPNRLEMINRMIDTATKVEPRSWEETVSKNVLLIVLNKKLIETLRQL